MNEDIDWDHSVEGDGVESPVVCVSRDWVLQALNEVKTGKALDHQMYHWIFFGFGFYHWIFATRGVGIQVMAEICQRVLDSFGMTVE